MKKIILFILSLSILFVLPGCGGDGNGGEAPSQPHWAKSYGGTGNDSASSIQQTSDGGYIVSGDTSSFGAGGYDFWVIKLDLSGNILWQKTYGGTEWDSASSIQQTSDGGYIVAGSSVSFGAGRGDGDFWVIKLDSSGAITWQKTFGGTGNDSASSIQQTSDGGYIVAGYTTSFRDDYYFDVWILKLDSSGNILWQKTYGGTSYGFGYAYSIQQTSDGGYIVAGYTYSFDTNSSGFGVIKLNSSGNILWQKTYGGTGNDMASSIQQTSDGGYIVSGDTSSFGVGGYDFWVIKLDSSGNILWQKTYGGTDRDFAYSIQQTSDGGYIVAGESTSFGAGRYDFWVIKLDSSGAITWQKTFGGTGNDSASSIQQTSDGGYIVAGSSVSFGAGSRDDDFWVLRLKSDGTISPSAPPNIGADTSATVQDTSVVPIDTSVTPVDSTATVTNTNVTGVDSNATVQTQASD